VFVGRLSWFTALVADRRRHPHRRRRNSRTQGRTPVWWSWYGAVSRGVVVADTIPYNPRAPPIGHFRQSVCDLPADAETNRRAAHAVAAQVASTPTMSSPKFCPPTRQCHRRTCRHRDDRRHGRTASTTPPRSLSGRFGRPWAASRRAIEGFRLDSVRGDRATRPPTHAGLARSNAETIKEICSGVRYNVAALPPGSARACSTAHRRRGLWRLASVFVVSNTCGLRRFTTKASDRPASAIHGEPQQIRR